MVALSVIISGSIGNYQQLSDKIEAWLDRDDLTDRIPDFIGLLEARLNRVLRSVNQETRTTWTTAAESYALPGDFRKLRKIHIEGSPDRPLTEISPQQSAMQFSGAAGTPRAYFIEGRTLTFCPPPASSTTFRATYWTRIEPLTVESSSNWLLLEHPDIYLLGGLLEAAIYIRDEEAINFLQPRLDNAIAELQRASRTDRYGGGPLVPNGPVQVRGAPC